MTTPSTPRTASPTAPWRTPSRRIFLLGGLGAALGVSACGTTTLTGSTAPTVPGAGTSGSAAAAAAGSGVAEVIGSYAIHDASTGTSVDVTVVDGTRRIVANGLPNHEAGSYPNQMTAQSYDFSLPVTATVAARPTVLALPQSFGVAINGVPFDPLAAEWYRNDPGSGWTIEVISPHSRMHLDGNHGHVQPGGAYHYHGIPAAVAGSLSAAAHSPLLGWAGDGFPIYARYGYAVADDPTSGVVDLASSYRLRSGSRPSGPGGAYDGTYTEDFTFVEDLGDLDEANGRTGVTPEYPEGTYYYVLTETFPFIPRRLVGTLAPSFVKNPGGRPR